jgi:hypothetical protein
MPDYSLVPVDHQPDFDDVSLVPVDHDPFCGSGSIVQQVQTQPALMQPQLTQNQPAQLQPPQFQPQSQPQPEPSPQPTPTVPAGSATEGSSASPFVDFFNQLAAPERAQSEGVADHVRNNPAAAKIEGAIGLGSLLFPPLAIAGAEGLGLFGAGLRGSAAADGLAGSTISGGGRAVAGSAARQAAGITSRSVAAFLKVYEGVARDNPSNLSAVHRAALLANILRNFQ